jgi:DNA-binding CsgD family transcriptional regulator/PAS domain-containing protein
MARITEEQELPRVLDEIVEAMKAQAAFLSSHPDGEIQAEAVGWTSHDTLSADHLTPLFAMSQCWPVNATENDFRWSSHMVEGRRFDVLALPVQPVEGHSQLMVTVWFEGRSAEQLKEAEHVYLRRRPFAVGYFRLWQMDRTRQRRLTALESALNLADFGVILLERSGEIAFCNRAATEIVEDSDGLRVAKGRLSATDLKSSVALRVSLEHVINATGDDEAIFPLMQLPRRSGVPLIAAVLPVDEPALERSHVAAVLYVVNPSLNLDKALPPICKLYLLSNTETQLALLLTSGHSLSEAAATMRVQEQTARTYLKTIFIKTGVRRQADLIRLLLVSLIKVPHKIKPLP